MRYRDAGVDVSRSDAIKDDVIRAIRSTWNPTVRPVVGGFAGIMAMPGGGSLVAATMDGVGTKLHLAKEAGRLEDAAADLVFHGADDLLVHGARPFAFLDYIAQARLEHDTVVAIVTGLSRACRDVGAVLLGGETAEMPDTYLEGVVDVAGCMLGHVAPDAVLDGSRVRPGDVLLGLASAGPHTNGYSLARRVLKVTGTPLAAPLPGGEGVSVGDALLAPHQWYGPALLGAIELGQVRAMAHVTGGGIAGNLVRVLPDRCRASVRASSWPRPAVMRWLIEQGALPEDDARQALNLGIGMVVVTAASDADAVAAQVERAGIRAWRVGEVSEGPKGVDWVD